MAKAGEYRHWVGFQAPVYTKNAQGEERITGWSTTVNSWASVRPLSGRELQYAQQTLAEVSHEVKLRYMDNIDETMRIVIDTRGTGTARYLQIGAVYSPGEEGAELVCLCTEIKTPTPE